ncbi:hypothetical protein PCE1_004933 [Barthelona sp. PCE]
MPRSKTVVSKNFTFTSFCNLVVVTDIINEFQQEQPLSIIDKRSDLILHGPPVDDSLLSGYEKWSMLKPSLLDPSIFYRTIHMPSGSILELFKFFEGSFVFFKRLELSFFFSGCLIDRLYLVNRKRIEYMNSQIEIYNIDTEDSVFSDNFEVNQINCIVQDGIVYVIGVNMYSYKAVALVSFTKDDIPFLSKTFFDIVALDWTPGNNRFILNNDRTVICERLLNLQNCSEVAKVFGVYIPRPSFKDQFHDVFCRCWNFISLDKEIYCTEYNEYSGDTIFYRICRRDVINCLFVLSNCTDIFSHVRYPMSLKRVPVLFNWFNQSIILLKPSTVFDNEAFIATTKFYDITAQKWSICFIIEATDEFKLYVNNETPIFHFPNRIFKHISLNLNHIAVIYSTFGDSCAVINRNFVVENVQKVEIVGDRAWLIENNSVLKMLMLHHETGHVTNSVEHILLWCVQQMIVNPYCQDECVITCSTGSLYVRFNPVSDSLDCVEIKCCGVVCFIDEGMLLSGYKAYRFCNEIEEWVIPSTFVEGKRFSPEPGVVAECRYIKGFQGTLRTLTFCNHTCSFSVTERNLDVVNFLSKCDVSFTFSSFGKFKL